MRHMMVERDADELLTLANRLTHAMALRKMSQREVAKKAGCSQQLISHLASGYTKKSSKLPDIAKALRVRHDWLYYNHGRMDLDSESQFDRETFINVVESTVEAALGGSQPLSPREIARLCLDVYESATDARGGEKFSKSEISRVAPVLLRHYKRRGSD